MAGARRCSRRWLKGPVVLGWQKPQPSSKRPRHRVLRVKTVIEASHLPGNTCRRGNDEGTVNRPGCQEIVVEVSTAFTALDPVL